MSIQCQILLEPTKEGVYRSGQSVRGTLKYSLNKPKTFAFIVIQLKGDGYCSWSETSGNSRTTYSGTEQYVSREQVVSKEGDSTVEAGVYDHPFEFVLPENLPSTFKNFTCKIAYKIIAVFSKSGNNFIGTKTFDTEIPVRGNVERRLAQPITFGLTKNLRSLMSTKYVDFKAEIEKTLLLPGESIHLQCSINNESDTPVTGTEMKLIAQTTYVSDCNSKNMERRVIKESLVECLGTKENSEAIFKCVVPTLPTLCSVQDSKILIIEYMLSVTAKFPFPHRNAWVEIPVVIGEEKKTYGHKTYNEKKDYSNDEGHQFNDGIFNDALLPPVKE